MFWRMFLVLMMAQFVMADDLLLEWFGRGKQDGIEPNLYMGSTSLGFRLVNAQLVSYVVKMDSDGMTTDYFVGKGMNGVVRCGLVVDDKMLLAGAFTTVNGVAQGRIAKLNADATLDTSFTGRVENGEIQCMAIQADGKILIGGSFTTVDGLTRRRVARLNVDGGVDTTFGDPNAGSTVFAMQVQTTGKIWIGGEFSAVGGTTRNFIARLNENGTLDTPNPNAGGGAVYAMQIQADDKVWVGGNFTSIAGGGRNRIARLNANGTLDTPNPNANSSVRSFKFQGDGKLLFGGAFTSVGGIGRKAIARLTTANVLDNTFSNTAAGTQSYVIHVFPDGNVLYGASGGSEYNNFMVNSNGVNVVSYGDGVNNTISFVASVGSEFFTAGLMTSAGMRAVSKGFNVYDEDGIVLPEPNLVFNVLNQTAMVPYGESQILLAGNFTTINGISHPYLARLNGDGTVDETFATVVQTVVNDIEVQDDGKIWIGGNFTTVNGVGRNRIARLNADGTLDTPNPNANNSVAAMALQSDGKLVFAGSFTTVGVDGRLRVARLNVDGTLDGTFVPSADASVNGVEVQPDGKIWIGGSFGTVNGSSRSRCARLNADGTLDAASVSFNNSIDKMWMVNGKLWAVGSFAVPRQFVARIDTATATVDGPTGLNPNQKPVALAPISDGSAWMAGPFTVAGGQSRLGLLRTTASGGLDSFAYGVSGGINVLLWK